MVQLLWKSLIVPQKGNHGVIQWPGNSILPKIRWYLLKRSVNMCLHKDLDTDVLDSPFHNSQKMEAARMSVTCWMDERNVAYLSSGRWLYHKKEQRTVLPHEEPWKHYIRRKKLDIKWHVWFHLCGISRTYKSMEKERRVVVARAGGKKNWRVPATVHGFYFGGAESRTFCNYSMAIDAYFYTCVRIH